MLFRSLEKAQKPVVLSGSGVLWSGAEAELREFVVSKGIPIYTTPQGRGVLEEDHPQAFLNARSSAMKETDCVIIVGTRLNYVFGHIKPPRISGSAKIIRIDVDSGEISNTPRADVAILGDAKMVLKQMLDASGTRVKAGNYAGWRGRLSEIENLKAPDAEKAMATSNTPIHPLRLCKEIKEFIDRDGVRSLHLGTAIVQSSMRIGAPDELVLSYTRSMMAFLLFHPRPRRVLLIGLGGGSIAKFLLSRLPDVSVTAVELNPVVVELARSHFALPADGERLRTVIGDGSAFVAGESGEYDVIMVDGYDGVRQAAALCTGQFFGDCARSLAADGILVANLWANDAEFERVLRRIETAFPAGTLCLPAAKPGNVAAFGFRKFPGNPRWEGLDDRARELEAILQLEFTSFVAGLRFMNRSDARRLLP